MSHQYWEIVVDEMVDRAGINPTPEQCATMAKVIEQGHEMYGESCGYEHIPDPIREENERLKKELKREQESRGCPDCHGHGRVVIVSGPWEANTDCSRCHGKGKIYQQ